MIIDVQNTFIIIQDTTNTLSPVDKSQLSFWKLQQEKDNVYRISLNKHVFLKVINYFEKEAIPFVLGEEANKYSEELEVSALEFSNIKELASNYKNGKFDRLEFDEFKDFVADKIKRPLRIHQLKAAFHLFLLGNGANFSVPGSGKTTVVLTVYEKLRLEGKVNTLFVVGPPSCFGPWKTEFLETLDRKPNFTILAGGNKTIRRNNYYQVPEQKSELYLTTFHSLLYDQTDVYNFLKQKHVKVFFVVDEAHYIKQLNGNWAQAILRQSEKAKYRCVLTGTPMPKSYTDIFNLFDFLWPDQSPISAHNKTLIKYGEDHNNIRSSKAILEESIGALFYRVRKSDLKLTNQNFFPPFILKMNKHEREIYDAIFKKIQDYSRKDYFKNIVFANAVARGRIMRLRQAVSYPKLLITAIDNYDERLFSDLKDLRNVIRQYDELEIPAKIVFLIKKIKQLQKKKLKVVIWSNFIETIKLIEKHLKNNNFYCKKIYGGTPVEGTKIKAEETREKIRDEFINQNSGLDILIANPAACAESISLHKTCHHSIYYDLSYNCAQFLQSLDRIHRVGGSETTEANYYFLQYENTIDIDIRENIDLKTKKMFDVIEQDYNIYDLDLYADSAVDDVDAYKRLFKKD